MMTSNLTSNGTYYNTYYNFSNNSSATNTVWYTTTTSYQPFATSYVYTDYTDFSNYASNHYGLREYMYANDLFCEIADILVDYYYCAEDDQEFENNLYRLTLDLLYDYIKQENAFEDFFNEKLFGYKEINEIIEEIIDRYHISIMEEC